jgi:hypothetical protein
MGPRTGHNILYPLLSLVYSKSWEGTQHMQVVGSGNRWPVPAGCRPAATGFAQQSQRSRSLTVDIETRGRARLSSPGQMFEPCVHKSILQDPFAVICIYLLQYLHSQPKVLTPQQMYGGNRRVHFSMQKRRGSRSPSFNYQNQNKLAP